MGGAKIYLTGRFDCAEGAVVFSGDLAGGAEPAWRRAKSAGRIRGPGTWVPFTDDVGDKESAKIKCGKTQF
jgi:hypothetical protein